MAPIAIIGGGPSGLMLARLLEHHSIDYIIYERDVSANFTPDQQGGSLDLHATTGQEAMKRAGLKEEFEKQARRGEKTLLVDKEGKQLLVFGEQERDAPKLTVHNCVVFSQSQCL